MPSPLPSATCPARSPIIEIGSFCGLSTNAITHFKEKLVSKNADHVRQMDF